MAADRPRSSRQRPRFPPGTVRVRLTIAAVIAVAAALAVGAVTLVSVLNASLTGEMTVAARSRAAEVAASLESGARPNIAVAGADDELVQVLDRSGTVVGASPNVAGRSAVVRLRPGQSSKIEYADEDFVAVAAGADTPAGPVTVIAARTLVDVFESTQIVTRLLVVGLPVLLVLLAFLTWKLVGRALAPVEAIRSEVDGISAAELHRRVPVPPGSDEIARLAATMNRMLHRLERARDSQRRFVSDASHELRSPVASIRQHAEVALAHPERTTMTELAETVLAEDLRVQRLVDDLLLLARVDEHTLQLRRRPVDLDDLVFDEARHLRETTSLRIGTAAVSAGRVDGDATVLRRLLRNLADNAARHARGQVSFALTEQAGHVVLTVEDDGPGIPVAERARMFERFVRLADHRARGDGGSGLGLAIVAALVRAHGGSVAIESSGLGGTQVSVTLPGG